MQGIYSGVESNNYFHDGNTEIKIDDSTFFDLCETHKNLKGREKFWQLKKKKRNTFISTLQF